MPTPVFKLTAADLKRRLNPLNASGLFTYGTGLSISENDVNIILEEQEETLMSMLPQKYTELCTEVNGEILCKSHKGGDAHLQTGFNSISKLKLYVNYPDPARPYSDREYSDVFPENKYTVTTATGAIVIHSLSAGSKVYADYKHTGAEGINILRNLILKLATIEVYDTFPQFGQNRSNNLQAMREDIESKVSSFYSDSGNASGIAAFDKLKLIVNSRRNERHTLRLPPLGGF